MSITDIESLFVLEWQTEEIDAVIPAGVWILYRVCLSSVEAESLENNLHALSHHRFITRIRTFKE